nr:PE-PGRS family protein PE_PGRS16-like [Aegilops tauschii subsp. strangulata]
MATSNSSGMSSTYSSNSNSHLATASSSVTRSREQTQLRPSSGSRRMHQEQRAGAAKGAATEQQSTRARVSGSGRTGRGAPGAARGRGWAHEGRRGCVGLDTGSHTRAGERGAQAMAASTGVSGHDGGTAAYGEQIEGANRGMGRGAHGGSGGRDLRGGGAPVR